MLFHGVAKARLAASYYRFLFFYFPFSRSQIMLGGRSVFFFYGLVTKIISIKVIIFAKKKILRRMTHLTQV